MDRQSHIALFNDERYQSCNLRSDQRLFQYTHVVENVLVGTLAGVVDDRLLDCGHSAPFGGVDFARMDVPFGSVDDLVEAACERARTEGVDEIVIRSRPAYFGANETAVEFALLNRGAKIDSCEVTLGLESWRYRTIDDYERALKSSARRALRHGLDAGASFGPAADVVEWAACYELLAETRRRRGVSLSVSFDYVIGLRKIFGDRIAMYRLMRSEELAGAALVYRVTRDWLYVVAWGDDIRYRPDSVVNCLAYHLVDLAIGQRIGIVDLGISSVGGVPDDGLIQFKRNIGAATGLRINYRLPLV